MKSEEDFKKCTTNGVKNESIICFITNENYKLKEENRKLRNKIEELKKENEVLLNVAMRLGKGDIKWRVGER